MRGTVLRIDDLRSRPADIRVAVLRSTPRRSLPVPGVAHHRYGVIHPYKKERSLDGPFHIRKPLLYFIADYLRLCARALVELTEAGKMLFPRVVLLTCGFVGAAKK